MLTPAHSWYRSWAPQVAGVGPCGSDPRSLDMGARFVLPQRYYLYCYVSPAADLHKMDHHNYLPYHCLQYFFLFFLIETPAWCLTHIFGDGQLALGRAWWPVCGGAGLWVMVNYKELCLTARLETWVRCWLPHRAQRNPGTDRDSQAVNSLSTACLWWMVSS